MKVNNRRCQCRGCGKYFNSVIAFEKHRKGDYQKGRYCDTSGMPVNSAGYYVTSLRVITHKPT